MDHKKIFIKSILSGFYFMISVVFFGLVGYKVYGAISTVTTGSPLTASNWNNMISNFFWGSGSGGIYYNGKVGIGTNSPNRTLHVYDTIDNAEIDIQSVAGAGKHWGIYQNATTQNLHMRNGSDRVIITTGGNMNLGGTLNAGGTVNAAGGICMNGDCKTAWAQVGSSVALNYTGTCDSAHKGATGISGGYYKVCNGIMWLNVVSADSYFAGSGTSGDPYRLSAESSSATTVLATTCNYYNLNATTLNNGVSRGTGSCGGGKACLTSGIYRIDLDGAGGNNATNVYCDMTNDVGGRTRIYYNQSSQENYVRYRTCKNSNSYSETNFECINPTLSVFTNLRFKRSGYTDVVTTAASVEWVDLGGCTNTGVGCRTGRQFPYGGGRYTMRDYHTASGFNTGRWGSEYGLIQNQFTIYGK